MVRMLSHSVLFLLFMFGVTSCTTIRSGFQQERFPLYDVRDVTVFANQPAAASLIAGVDRRVSAAIAATRRLQWVPRVVLTVRIEYIAKGLGVARDRHEAEFTVDAVSVDNGTILTTGNFKAIAFSFSPAVTDEILAEAIAARIRDALSLMTPSAATAGYERFPAAPAPVAASSPAEYLPEPAGTPVGEPNVAPRAEAPASFHTSQPDREEALSTPAPKSEASAPRQEIRAAGSDLETGAKGRVTLKTTAPSLVPCADGSATPCGQAQQ